MNHVAQCNEYKTAFEGYERSISQSARSVAGVFGRFIEIFDREYRHARQQRVLTTPNLSVLKVFGLRYRELRHSDALAWFLRENSEHEQGDLFLRAFLKQLSVKIPENIKYTVDRERHNNIDISAYAAGVFAIFIENKIRGREEEEDQFERLVESLNTFSKNNGIPEDARIAVFLTDDGRPPVTAPESSHNIRRIDLFDAFAEALQTAPNSPLLVRFLENYCREIKMLI